MNSWHVFIATDRRIFRRDGRVDVLLSRSEKSDDVELRSWGGADPVTLPGALDVEVESFDVPVAALRPLRDALDRALGEEVHGLAIRCRVCQPDLDPFLGLLGLCYAHAEELLP